MSVNFNPGKIIDVARHVFQKLDRADCPVFHDVKNDLRVIFVGPDVCPEFPFRPFRVDEVGASAAAGAITNRMSAF